MTPKKDEYMRGYADGFKDAKEVVGKALMEIRDRHIPDCPAHFAGSEQDWVERQYIELRRIARAALQMVNHEAAS